MRMNYLQKKFYALFKSLKIKLHNSSIRSFKDVTSFALKDSEFPQVLSGYSTSNHLMLKKKSDQKSRLLPTNKPLIPTCLYANMYVSTSRAHMLPTSTDVVSVPNVKSCMKSSQSSATVPSVPPVWLTTSVRNNVIKKPIACRDSEIKRHRKAANYVSKLSSNVVNCYRSFSTSSSGFVCQSVCFNKSVHKHKFKCC